MANTQKPLILTVLLYVKSGKFEQFQAYETQAAQVMEDYGGKIDRVIRPVSMAGEKFPLPDEIHLVSFPCERDFERYKLDPRMSELKSLRQEAIANTIVIVGTERELYG
ncbi:hypothetical protein [Lusitaniella coriacea]|uniref:hypothetical protein n=1 Tax=Lusitaniella coriacea TaxID=1983105 RepID=UPI003CF7E593